MRLLREEREEIKLWIDDLRPAPDGYLWIKSVDDAINEILLTDILRIDDEEVEIELISLDHDAGDYASQGGDYIEVLKWLEATGRNYPIRIHSMNIVGVENMRRIIRHNGWKEVF